MKNIWELAWMQIYLMADKVTKDIDNFLKQYMTKKWYIPNFIYKKIYKLEIHKTNKFWTDIYKIYKFWKKIGEKKFNY